MKIYFCDGCNESIPLADVQSAQVTTIKGKLFCRNCIPPGTLTAAAPPAPARRTAHPVIWLLLAALVGWTAWRDRDLWLTEGPMAAEGPAVTVEEVLASRVDSLEARLGQLGADAGGLSRDVLSLRGELGDLRLADTEQARTIQGLADDIDRLAGIQVATGEVVERIQLHANRLDVLEGRLEALSGALDSHQAAHALGATEPAATAAGAGAEAEPEIPAAPMPDPARVAESEEVRRLLRDPEPDLRFEGVGRVEEGDFRELVPELVRLLEDDDQFVRIHAMIVLGGFGSEEAVGPLFDVLEDDNAAIRRTAAETLVKITGYDPGYEYKGSTAERNRAVRKWRDWWQERERA